MRKQPENPLRKYLKGKNQAEFARKIGVCRSSITEVKNDRARFSPEKAQIVQRVTKGRVKASSLVFRKITPRKRRA